MRFGTTKAVFVSLILAFGLSSCEKEKRIEVEIELVPKWGDEPFSINTKFANSMGDSLRFTKMKLYLSEIKLEKHDGSLVQIKDIAYFNVSQDDPSMLTAVSSEFEQDDFMGISFNFGITESQNNTDPTSVSCPGHPLCSDNDMYWGPILKYVYTKIEGNVKPAGGSIFDVFLYHVGTIPYLRNIVLDRHIDFNAEKKIKIIFDLKKVLDNSNDPFNMLLQADRITQTDENPTLAGRFSENIETAFNVE